MANLIISGSTNPEIGKETFYSIFPVGLNTTIHNSLSPISNEKAHWEIYVLEKRRWRKATGNTKFGDTVSFNFKQSSVARAGLKIVVTRGSKKGELIIKPQKAGNPKVNSVSLFDKNYNKITKPLNYADTIIARAHCTDMEGEKIYFTLWEDDAIGAGHDKINQINKINPIPLSNTVVDGKAEVKFNMALYTLASRIADMQVAKGDKSEGKNHEYYVTVDYYGKMVGESKNINIKNPNHENPIQRAYDLQYPERVIQKPKPPNKHHAPPPAKPKKDTFKAPVTAGAKTKAADPKGKILSAHFVNLVQQPIKDLQMGVPFCVKIRSNGLKGKTVILRLFEEDATFDDLVYEQNVLISSDVILQRITITDEMRKKGGDLYGQQYYIEIEHSDQSVKSSVLNLRDDTLLTKLKTAVSTAGVKKQETKKKQVEECVCKQYDLIWGNKVSCEFRKKVVEISKRQNFDPNDLMAVMKVETSGTFSPSKIDLKPTKEKRKDGNFKKDYRGLTKEEILQLQENFRGAVGLIQFTPVAISSLNKNYGLSLTKRKLALMSQLDQLDYVEKYIELWKKTKEITTKISLSDLYVLVFAPNYFGSPENTTLYKEGTEYYEENSSVDTDRKNGITKKEIAIRAITAKTEGLNNKETNFSCQRSIINPNNTINSNSDIEFHILSNNGEIHYKITNEKREVASYFYHDKNGKIHDIGKQKLKKVFNKYGTQYKDRIKGDSVYLLDIRNLKNYINGKVKFKLVMNPKTNRFYMNDVTLAAFVGAMLDCGFDDFTFNGFSDSEGRSIGGSKSHKNGMNGDLRYLRKDKSGRNVHLDISSETGDPCGWKGMDEVRQNQFINALYKYGWKSMLSWKFNNGRLLNHSIQYEDHHHHIHLQSFTPKLKQIK